MTCIVEGCQNPEIIKITQVFGGKKIISHVCLDCFNIFEGVDDFTHIISN